MDQIVRAGQNSFCSAARFACQQSLTLQATSQLSRFAAVSAPQVAPRIDHSQPGQRGEGHAIQRITAKTLGGRCDGRNKVIERILSLPIK
jgi:hypothetical protein